MMLNSHIAQQHNAALQHEALVVAARARMVSNAGRPLFADRLRSALGHPFPRGRMVSAKNCA